MTDSDFDLRKKKNAISETGRGARERSGGAERFGIMFELVVKAQSLVSAANSLGCGGEHCALTVGANASQPRFSQARPSALSLSPERLTLLPERAQLWPSEQLVGARRTERDLHTAEPDTRLKRVAAQWWW